MDIQCYILCSIFNFSCTNKLNGYGHLFYFHFLKIFSDTKMLNKGKYFVKSSYHWLINYYITLKFCLSKFVDLFWFWQFLFRENLEKSGNLRSGILYQPCGRDSDSRLWFLDDFRSPSNMYLSIHWTNFSSQDFQ